MASKRIVSRLTTAHTARVTARPFSSTATWAEKQHRAPALSDVSPGNATSFDQKQQQFRSELSSRVKAQKEKDRQQQSQSSKSTSTSFPPTDSVMNSHGALEGGGLGSLSTAETGQAHRERDEAATATDPSKKKPGTGRLSSLIYGTEEGREMDREIERSFSQVLARGKYVHSVVFHEVKPDKVDEYVKLVGDWYPRMASMPENKVNLVGSWRTEVGDCDTFGEPEIIHGVGLAAH